MRNYREIEPVQLSFDELISENEALHNRLRQLKNSAHDHGPGKSPEPKDSLFFQGVFQAGPLGMAPTSRESEFIDVNERLCRMLGYGKEELISHRMADFTHPGDAALGASEFRLLPKDGKFIYVKHRKNTIRNAAGAPVNRLDIV